MRVKPVIFLAVLAGVGLGLTGTARADRDDQGHGRWWAGPLFSFGLSVPAYAPPPAYYPPPPVYQPPRHRRAYAAPPPVYYAPQPAYYPPPPGYYAPPPPPPPAYYAPPPVAVAPPALSFGMSIPLR